MKHRAVLLLCGLLAGWCSAATPKTYDVDICIYGGTDSGVAAALAARRRGRSVVVIEPFRHLGGIAGGGIRITLLGLEVYIGCNQDGNLTWGISGVKTFMHRY